MFIPAAHQALERLKVMEVQPYSLISHFSPQHASQWEALIFDSWVLLTVSKGCSMQCRYWLPKFNGVRTAVTDPLRSSALRRGNCGASQERCHQIWRKLFSIKGVPFNLFPCSKAGWQLYPILDGQQLDRVIRDPCFLMQHTADILQALSKGNWFMGLT